MHSAIDDLLGVSIGDAVSLVADGQLQSRSLAICDDTDPRVIILYRRQPRNVRPTIATIDFVPILQRRYNTAYLSEKHRRALLPVGAEVTQLNSRIPFAHGAEITYLVPEFARRQWRPHRHARFQRVRGSRSNDKRRNRVER